MREIGIVLLCAIAATNVWGQAPAQNVVPPSIPQKQPMGIRPIRVPQLAPLQPVPSGPAVQVPFAMPEPVQAIRSPQTISPPGVTGLPGQPFPYTPPGAVVPGQPLQPIQPGQASIPQTYQPPPAQQPAHYLAWNVERLETNPPPGAASTQFTFWFTNVSSEVVTIRSGRGSCSCTTVAPFPTQPWEIPAGSNGPIQVNMNLAGKFGSVEKGILIDTTAGYKSLVVRVNLPRPTNAAPAFGGIDADRLKNMQAALADRQVLFKGECAKCHSEPAIGKSGEPLYVAACGICHDSTHRAAMVPDLKQLKHPTNEEHWRKWIRSGRPGSMMPAFARAEGGPLSDDQVESLVKFLMDSITATSPRPAPPLDSASVFPLPPAKSQ